MRFHLNLGLGLSTYLLSTTTLSLAQSLTGLTVQTQQGLVLGTFIYPTVRQFLGIPYAISNRWESPTLPPQRNSSLPFLANKFGDACVQIYDESTKKFMEVVGAGGIDVEESENCLSVNVWAPSLNRKQKTAVMIWIHGGGFTYGTSNTPTYQGQNFVRDQEDIIIVTFNYRLNIFGQPNSPQLVSTTQSQNFGLLDRDAVIQWVYDNIENFGGDKERIVLFGQSAGSASAEAYTYSNVSDTKVKGIINQSGSISGVPSANATINPTVWNAISNAVGCGTTTDTAQLTCMKNVPTQSLKNAVLSTSSTFGIISDDITLFKNTALRAQSGQFLKVPHLHGSTANEADIYVIVLQLLARGYTPPIVTSMISDIQTQLGFTCPTSITSNTRVKARVPTWRYLYEGIFPLISPRHDLRAYHASELPIIFGTYTKNLSTPLDQIKLSTYMQNAWATFARDPQNGLKNFGWPLYDGKSTPDVSDTGTLVKLGNYYNKSGVIFGSPGIVDATCAKQTNLAALAVQARALV